ncbi:hypothetical protein [Salinivibrio kushneri]|uniref:MarR family transcriptional regulator n=1 Tax=Salinivibrio kushneri TaxID=1908198 RepID=A0AB36K9F3_9GAMM|nr:hypothetical protein [Salinivibrio kushneri]OOE45311.1 hypothetical protein BZG09_05045 [Salinivibrio kushneri]WBA17871.1 hypothetical protein O4598_12410 [Salinivibrio kushneri]
MKQNNQLANKRESQTSTDVPATAASKKLRAMLFMLENPNGVTEKSINRAASVMSGRNYPTNLQRMHDIKLVEPKERRRGRDGSLYTIYQLASATEAKKLMTLVLFHCQQHGLTPPDEEYLSQLVQQFAERYQRAA